MLREINTTNHSRLSIIDNINNIIFQIDKNGNWSFLNLSWQRVMGFETNQSIGQPFYNNIHTDDIEEHYLLFSSIINEKKDHCSCNIRCIAQSGKTVWLKCYVVLLKDEQGDIIGASGTLKDITEDKQNSEIIELLTSNIPDIICVHELDGRYKYVSSTVSTISNYSEKDLLGKSPYNCCHPDDVDLLKNTHKKVIQGCKDSYITCRFQVKPNAYIWLETFTKRILNNEGAAIGFLTSSRSVDVKKKAEEQLILSLKKERELNLLKSRFVDMASHEFRTPLSIIQSSLELLQIYITEDGAVTQKISKHINNIFSEVETLNNLIDTILTKGKIDANAIDFKLEAIDIIALVNTVVRQIEEIQLDKRKVEIIIKGNAKLITTDFTLMTQIIYNLLSNAFKYSVGKKNPVITLHFNKVNFKINIKDYGIGVPVPDQAKIFQAFYRGENTYPIKGNGLGMFICKYFTTLLNGTIKLKETNEEGTLFSLFFKYDTMQ